MGVSLHFQCNLGLTEFYGLFSYLALLEVHGAVGTSVDGERIALQRVGSRLL